MLIERGGGHDIDSEWVTIKLMRIIVAKFSNLLLVFVTALRVFVLFMNSIGQFILGRHFSVCADSIFLTSFCQYMKK